MKSDESKDMEDKLKSVRDRWLADIHEKAIKEQEWIDHFTNPNGKPTCCG